MKPLFFFPVFISFTLVQDVGVGARPNTDRLSTVDALTIFEATSSPSSWLSVGTNMIKDSLSFDENIWNTTLHNAASLGSQIAESGVDYVKQGLQQSATPLGTSGIDQGSDLTTQVLGWIRAFPGLDFLSEIGKTTVNMASDLGTNCTNAVNTFEDSKLSYVNSLSQMRTNALSSIVNSRNSMEQEMITSGTDAVKPVTDTGFHVFQQLIDGIKSSTSERNHISNSLNVDREGSISKRNILRVPPR